MSLTEEQPQFNMRAVFRPASSPQVFGGNPLPPSSVTPEIDAVDDVMDLVRKADQYDEDEDEERAGEPSALIGNESSGSGDIREPFSMGDPPSLLQPVNPISRYSSTPLFGSSPGLGSLGTNPLARQTADSSVKDDPFNFGGTPASLSRSSSTLGSNSIDSIRLFSPQLVPRADEKPFPLGSGFSLAPPPSSTETNVFGSSASSVPFQHFHLSPLVQSSVTGSGSSSSLPPSASSSPPQMPIIFSQQLQPQPSVQPKLQPPSVSSPLSQPMSQPISQPLSQPLAQTQPQPQPTAIPQQSAPAPVQQSHSPPSQTHFVGTAPVFVPKSMMTASSGMSESAPTTSGNIPYSSPHMEFGGYPHAGMFNAMGTDSSHPDYTPGYVMDSSSPSVSANFRTKGCWYYFKTGHCQKGDRCNFSHERTPGMEIPPPVPSANMYVPAMPPYGFGVVPDAPMSGSPRTMVGKPNGISPFGVPPSSTSPQAPPSQQVVQPPSQPTSPPNFVAVQQLYRTKPCRFFFEKGTCLKGDRCNFSHDPAYAAAYAAANPNSGFQMPDMSRFNTGSNGSQVNATNGSSTVPGANGRTNTTPAVTGDGGVRGGNRHQQPSSGSPSSLLPNSAAALRLSSASVVDFPPLG